jgi:hypothetical protein
LKRDCNDDGIDARDSRLRSRREMLATLGRLGICLPIIGHAIGRAQTSIERRFSTDPATHKPALLATADEQLLEEIERASFLFFWEQGSPLTGLISDRSRATGKGARGPASIAATGFGLAGLCIGEHRSYIDKSRARERALATLRFLWERLPNKSGFFFHFVDASTGERLRRSEVSSIDTAILLCGVLTCGQHFADEEIQRLTRQIYERVDWRWFLDGALTLSMGWKPEGGFLKSRWDSYSEMMMIYLLGLGSSSHPLPAETWDAWKRPTVEYDGIRFIGSRAPLFVHQYSHAWFDFRDKRDRYADYFMNSTLATEAHRRFCLDLARKFPDFGEDLWGITASDSAHGYVVWGGPPPIGPLDGTLVPCAAGGSIPFLPDATMRVLRTMRERFSERAWDRYGFVDAFNPRTHWFDRDVIGIDVGITMLMAENARSRFVWDTFMKNDEVQRGMERAGFRPYPSTVPNFGVAIRERVAG